jgi:carbon-monoxide dehydrogenase medium subunit
MYPPKFDYYRANTVDEAVSLLGQHAGAKLLAGGHSLIPILNLRLADPGVIIDIGRIDGLDRIFTDRGGNLRIGALTTHAAVAASADLPAVLTDAAAHIGDPQVRNRGTVGGNISHADPASDLPAVMLALGATFHATGPGGSRDIAADDFFTGLFETALAEGDVLTGVSIPAQANGTGSAYAKLSNPASRYAIVGAAAVVTVKGNQCESARVAVGGVAPFAIRASSVEAALAGQKLDEDSIKAAAAAVQNDLGGDIMSDIHASADYRRKMAAVFIARAVAQAAERAQKS